MAAPSPSSLYGLVARLDELITLQPGEGLGGFAPGGKVRTHQFGGHRSAFRGRGMEFDEVRAYQPGDDIRTIDWRVTARTGRTHTKLFQEERERPVLLLSDARRAMRFGTRDCFKSVLSARVTALLTWVALAGNDRVGGVTLSPTRLVAHKPERSRRRILHFLKSVAAATQDAFEDSEAKPRAPVKAPAPEPALCDALERLRMAARPGTLIFLASDFDDFDDAAALALSRLSAVHQVTALFIHDPLEESLPARGYYRISDGERVAVLDAARADQKAAWARHFAARRGRLELFCRKHGIAFLPVRTGDDPAAILHPERLGRARGGRGVSGRGAA